MGFFVDTDDGSVLTGGEVTKVHGWRIFMVFLLLVLLAGPGSWAIGVWTAPWVGQANVHRQIYTPNNIIGNVDQFHNLDSDINADAANLKTEEAQAKSHAQVTQGQPDPLGQNAAEQSRLESVVTSTSAHCESLVAQYNNMARNYTQAPFRTNDLPYQEDATQCEVTP